MALDIKQTLRLSQQLVMTPQLQQAIKLLQLGRMELAILLRKELLENPVLEESTDEDDKEVAKEAEKPSDDPSELKVEGDGANEIDWENYLSTNSQNTSGPIKSADKDAPSYENILTNKKTLSDHLYWQLKLSAPDEKTEAVGELIIGNIDEDGYFRSTPEEVAEKSGESVSFVESILAFIQTFDPIGIASRDLCECLLLQTNSIKNPYMIQTIIKNHLHDLEIKNYKAIQKALNISFSEVVDAVKKIAKLEPKPGRAFYDTESVYITPDIFVYNVGGEFIIALNEDGLPKLRISNFYKNIMRTHDGGNVEKEYINEKLKSAIWLIRSIHQRQRTIYRVTESIIKFQLEFFRQGIAHLKPMVLKDVADDISMHESTISRVTTNKYMHTPQGIFELKYFFNSAIKTSPGEDDVASQTVKDKIKKIISCENTKKPLSDQEIVDMLKTESISIARRTVAKYREILNILPSSKRKQLF